MSDAAAEITWPYTHALKRPANTPGGELTELTLREPTVADFLKFGVLDNSLSGENIVEMVAALSGKAPPVIKALPGAEMLALTRKLSDFLAQASA